MASATSLDFPPYRLDLRDGLLYRGAAVVPLRPKAYALLSYLCTHAHAVLSTDTLLRSVWPERVISEAGLTELIRELRQAAATGHGVLRCLRRRRSHARGYAAAEVADVYGRAQVLFDEVGEPSHLFSILWGLWLYYVVRGNHIVAYDIARQLLELEQRHGIVFPLAQYVAGCSQFWLGEVGASLTTLDCGLANYDATIHVRQVSLYSQDARAVMLLYRAWDLWFLGYPDQARDSAASAIAWATELGHPFSLAFARGWSAVVYYLCRQPSDGLLHAETEQAISLEHGFPFWHAWSRVMAGWAMVGMHDDDHGFAIIETGLSEYQATGAAMGTTLFLAMRADACAKAGHVQEGLRGFEISDPLNC